MAWVATDSTTTVSAKADKVWIVGSDATAAFAITGDATPIVLGIQHLELPGSDLRGLTITESAGTISVLELTRDSA